MKKLHFLILVLAASFTLHAQWADDPINNNFIANCNADASEIYTSTDPVSGYTFVQWTKGSNNGWAPWLQCLNFEGVPQWGDEGIHITTPNLASWSPGYAMAATNDGGVVSVFRTADAQHFAVRINADGTFPWGEHGIMLFNGLGGDRSEVMAGNDGGVWALGTDYDNTYLQYVNADGTLGPVITMGDGEHQYTFGLMVPTIDNSVLVVYEKESWAYTYYYEKEIWVVGYTTDGVQIAPEQQLMAPYTMGGSYCHYVVPDGQNGGYAYMWHDGIGGAYNVYVFHFDEYGNSTISGLDGVSVHSTDPQNYYLDAYATVDPMTHDLIIAYEVKDTYTQSQDHIYMNRITSSGDKVWGEGILVADYTGVNYAEIKVDAFEDGNGFCIIYKEDELVRAKGFDKDGNLLWSKTMSTSSYNKSFCENSAGFHLGQNVVAWVNSSNGNVYGQNIGPDGTMGPIEIPVITCLAPENFQGEYYYDEETGDFGTKLTWDAPETQPLHYNLYFTDPSGCMTTIEIAATETGYFDQTTCIGNVTYRLTAVYENCESDYALTPEGENYVIVEVTGIPQNETTMQVAQRGGKLVIHSSQALRNVMICNLNGQVVKTINLDGTDLSLDVEGWSKGLYILRIETKDGMTKQLKTVVQ